VHVRTDPDHVGAARAAGLDAEPVDPRIPDVQIRDYDAGSEANRLRTALAALMARGPYERADIEAAMDATGADVLLVDTNTYGAAVAAERSGRPWATLMPSLLALPGRGIPPYGLGMRPIRGPGGRVRDAVLWRVVERMYGRSMLPPLNRLRADAGLRPLRSPIDHLLAPARLLVMASEPLEYPRIDLAPSVRFVGAQRWDPPAETPPWLIEPGDPWVLVTLSTDYQADERLAAAAIEALRDEPVRVLVTLGDAQDVADLPAAPNARLERFVAHGPVLEHAAAVVSHGGMGIVQKAMAAGVPMVAVPFGRDQPEVARRVAESGAGVKLKPKRLTPERVRAAVREAIALRPQAQAAGRRLRAAGGPERFADAVEELAEPAAVARAA